MDKCSFHGRLAELSIALSSLPRLAHLQPQDQATFSPSSLRLMQPGRTAAVAREGARDLLPGALRKWQDSLVLSRLLGEDPREGRL